MGPEPEITDDAPAPEVAPAAVARFVFTCWGLSRLLLLGPLLLAAGRNGLPPFPDVLLRWDTLHYIQIAREGATGDELAFFPLWPWLLGTLGGGSETRLLLVGLCLANGAFLLALVLLHWQAGQLWGAAAARWTVLIACFLPLSLFSAIPYTESLYLLLTGASLALAEGVGAGVLGGLAAATRPTGIVLAPALLLGGLARRRASQGLLAAALTCLGLGAVMLEGWRVSGNPLAFQAAQKGWGLTPGLNLSGLPSWGRLLSQILIGPSNTEHGFGADPWFPLAMAVLLGLAILAFRLRQRRPRLSFGLGVFALLGAWLLGGAPFLNGAIIAASAALLLWGRRQLPPAFWAFGALSVVSYLLKQSTISLERHLYATVPLLLLGGLWSSAHPRWGRFLVGFGGLLAITFSLRLSRGEWVG